MHQTLYWRNCFYFVLKFKDLNQLVSTTEAWESYRYSGLPVCLPVWWPLRWSLEDTQHWNVCMNVCTALCGREGIVRPWSCSVLFWPVFTQHAVRDQERTMAWGLSKWRHKSVSTRRQKVFKCYQNVFYIRCTVGANENVCRVLCVGVVGEGGRRLHVFESRLKIRTGRARFRETGKLMQGNGLRHQPAHHSLC